MSARARKKTRRLTKTKLRRWLKGLHLWMEDRGPWSDPKRYVLPVGGLFLLGALSSALSLTPLALVCMYGAALLISGTFAFMGITMWVDAAAQALSSRRRKLPSPLTLVAVGAFFVAVGISGVFGLFMD